MIKLTLFGRYLKKRKISYDDAANALNLTRSYVNMLCTGKATPGLKAAARINKWTRGGVPFEAWL